MKILQVFNRYLEKGGEEKSVDRIFNHAKLSGLDLERCFFDSAEWSGKQSPSQLAQLKKLFYNAESAKRLSDKIKEVSPDALLFHNIFPVGSPALYKAALDHDIPVIQYIHNFRPFSVSGTLWNGTRITEESLRGDYLSEVLSGSWQDSKLKSLVFAVLLKKLHSRGWLKAIKHWVAISDFMRDKFIEAGVSPENITTLKHSWDMLAEMPDRADKGYYLFLGRLTSEKGVRLLLESWSALERCLGNETPQLYIGGVGELENEVIAASGKSSKIDYLGYVDSEEKAGLISGCRAMLAPSIWWEPLGLVTYEAYDYGKPILAAASGGLTETVIHETTGLLYSSNNEGAIVEAIIKFEDFSNEEREAMGEAGRNWLRVNTSPEDWQVTFGQIVERVK